MRARWHRHTAWVPLTVADWRYVQRLTARAGVSTPNLLRRALRFYAMHGHGDVPGSLPGCVLRERATTDRKEGRG